MTFFLTVVALVVLVTVVFGAYGIGGLSLSRRMQEDFSQPNLGPIRTAPEPEVKRWRLRDVYAEAPYRVLSWMSGMILACIATLVVGLTSGLAVGGCGSSEPQECLPPPAPCAEMPTVSWEQAYALHQFTLIADRPEDITATERRF